MVIHGLRKSSVVVAVHDDLVVLQPWSRRGVALVVFEAVRSHHGCEIFSGDEDCEIEVLCERRSKGPFTGIRRSSRAESGFVLLLAAVATPDKVEDRR